MQYLPPVYLAWFFTVECFASAFWKLSLSTVIYVVIMAYFFCISISIINQHGKTVKGSKIFEIKAEQNHIFRKLFDVFSELQGINTGKKYLDFIILYENKYSICLNHNITKACSVQRRFLQLWSVSIKWHI